MYSSPAKVEMLESVVQVFSIPFGERTCPLVGAQVPNLNGGGLMGTTSPPLTNAVC